MSDRPDLHSKSVWNTALTSQMQCKWLGERVAAPSLRLGVKNAITKTTAPSCGPNATFRFPTHGGTGGIWTAVSALLPPRTLRFGPDASIRSIDLEKKEARVGSEGRIVKYRKLISTMAVDHFLDIAAGQGVEEMRKSAKGLVWSSTIVLGIGIRGSRPERIGDKCECWRLVFVLELLPSQNTILTSPRLAVLPRRQRALLPRHHLLQLLRLQLPGPHHCACHLAPRRWLSRSLERKGRWPILVDHV